MSEPITYTELMYFLESKNNPELLDDLVIDVSSNAASLINNDGMESQIEYLENQGWQSINQLDDMIHDEHEKSASLINNEGLSAQVEYLQSEGWTFQQIFEEIKGQEDFQKIMSQENINEA